MRTSAKVKNKWNEKTYDRVYVTIPKGYGDKIREQCKEQGISVNSAVFDEVNRRMETSEDDLLLAEG